MVNGLIVRVPRILDDRAQKDLCKDVLVSIVSGNYFWLAPAVPQCEHGAQPPLGSLALCLMLLDKVLQPVCPVTTRCRSKQGHHISVSESRFDCNTCLDSSPQQVPLGTHLYNLDSSLNWRLAFIHASSPRIRALISRLQRLDNLDTAFTTHLQRFFIDI